MTDYLVRIITKTGSLRGLACISTGVVSEACRRHGTAPTASAALGRVLTGAALLGALLKGGQRIAIKVEGNGPLKKILAEAESDGSVAGYVAAPDVDLPSHRKGKLDVAAAVGHAGFLTVTKDLGLKEPYRGTVQLLSSEIAEDLAYYLTTSEQVPSAVGLSVLVAPEGDVAVAGGFLIQSLPPEDEAAVSGIMDRIAQLPPLSELLLAGTTPEMLLERLFQGIPYEILETRPLSFRCSCNREKVERALIAMGGEELSRLMAEDGEAVATCEFCRETYRFGREELEELVCRLS